MSLLRRFIRNCSSFFFLLFCFSVFSVSVFASVQEYSPSSFSDCGSEGESCTDLKTGTDLDPLLTADDSDVYTSSVWPDSLFEFSGTAWDDDDSNPYLMQFNFDPSISGTVVGADFIFDGVFSPSTCSIFDSCKFKFLSSINSFTGSEKIHEQPNLNILDVLNLSIPSGQLNNLDSLSVRLLAYGTPITDTSSGIQSLIDQVKLTATVDEDPPSVPVLEWPIGGAYIDDNSPLMQWADSTDDESGIKNYLYRVYYNCSDSLDIPASCSSLYPDEDGLVRTSSEYQAGSTSDGTYYWQVRAVDGIDKMSDWSSLEEITIDTVSPVVSNLQVDKSLVTAGDIITIEADVVDSSGISAVSADFSYNQTYTSRPSPTSTGMTHVLGDTYRVQYTVPTSWNDGDMYIKVAARDKTTGNWMRSTEQEIIEVDSTAPTVSIDAPSTGFVNGQVVINGSVIDDHPHHYWLVIQDDQGQTIAGPGTVQETNSLTNYNFMTWDTNGVVDGDYTIILHARDALDLKDANSMTEVIVTVDNTHPIITFDQPLTATVHSGIVHLQASCNEECDYVNFWWKKEGEEYLEAEKRYHIVNTNGTFFEWDLDTLNALKADGSFYALTDGTYYLYGAGKDVAGNWARTSEISIVVDNTNPTVDITSPLNGETISGTTTVTVTATDSTSEVERVELSYRAVGDATWIPLDTLFVSPYTYDWNTTGYPLGDYELKAEAFDIAGNFETDQIEVGVAAVISGETGSTPYFGQIYVSWSTDRPTTAQVVYDTTPHLSADPSLFNYGYAYTTGVFDLGKTIFHETLLTGLNNGTTYYYRFISAGSPTAVSGEMSNRTFSSSGPGSPPSGGGGAAPLLASMPSVLGTSTYYYIPTGSILPEEGEILGEETTPTPEPEKSPPTITTPTPKVLGALTSVSPLYFLGGGLLISLILMLLLFRRE